MDFLLEPGGFWNMSLQPSGLEFASALKELEQVMVEPALLTVFFESEEGGGALSCKSLLALGIGGLT